MSKYWIYKQFYLLIFINSNGEAGINKFNKFFIMNWNILVIIIKINWVKKLVAVSERLESMILILLSNISFEYITKKGASPVILILRNIV